MEQKRNSENLLIANIRVWHGTYIRTESCNQRLLYPRPSTAVISESVFQKVIFLVCMVYFQKFPAFQKQLPWNRACKFTFKSHFRQKFCIVYYLYISIIQIGCVRLCVCVCLQDNSRQFQTDLDELAFWTWREWLHFKHRYPWGGACGGLIL